MINAYNEILSYEGDEWEDFLTKICLVDIFKDLLPLFKDKSALKQAIRYIIYCYSKNSDSIILGDDWLLNKKRIFEKTFLPKEYYEDLVLLNNRIIVNVIQKWVDFQDAPVFSQLISLKELMVEMQLSSNSKIIKSNNEVDYDQKFKNACYVKDLGKMIQDLESELIQKDMKLKEGIQELKTAKRNVSVMGVEKYAV